MKMFGLLPDDSKVGRNFALLISLLINRPIFEYELAVYDQEHLLKTVADNNERQALSEDYKKLEAIKRSTRHNNLLWWLARVISFMAMVRGLIFVYVTHFQYEAYPRVAGLSTGTLRSEDGVVTENYSYYCLKSNCSSLFGSHLETSEREQNLAKLPAFYICHEALASMTYIPMEHDYGRGTHWFTIIVAASILIDLAVHKFRAGDRDLENSMLMFLVAPNLSCKVMFERAKQLMKEVRHSFKNFIELQRIRRCERIASRYQAGLASHSIQQSRQYQPRSELDWPGLNKVDVSCKTTEVQPPSLMLNNLMMCRFEHTDEGEFARDCLPLIGKMIDLARELHKATSEANCSIWIGETGAHAKDDVTKIMPELNVSLLVLYIADFASVTVWGIVRLFDLLLSTWELRCWICELRYKLMIVQPLLRDFHRWSMKEVEPFWGDEPDMVFRYDLFRDKFKREVKVSLFRLDHGSFAKLNKRIENERMLENNYVHIAYNNQQARGGPERMLAGLLEKLYVETRLMIELRDKTERRMSIIIIVGMALDYSIYFVTIYLSRVMYLPWDMSFSIIFCTLYPISLIMNSTIMSHQVSF
jgi:hypothetical protein